jgi:hypothetical protein
MADIFISYSKKHAQLTVELSRDLEAEGYTTWWDTSLLPGDEFPDEIKRQLEAAKAVIVIWTASSVCSKWVRSEATLADDLSKLITVCDESVNFHDIPLPFNTRQTDPVADRSKIFAALQKRGIRPARMPRTETPGPAHQDSLIPREPAASVPANRPLPKVSPVIVARALRNMGKDHSSQQMIDAAAWLEKTIGRTVGHHPQDDKEILIGCDSSGPYLEHNGNVIRIRANEIDTIGLNQAVTLLLRYHPEKYELN